MDSKGNRVGGTQRDHLKTLARRGAPKAIQALANPYEYPESLRYLHDYAKELYGRSGFSEVGVMPLSWPVLHAWMQATGRDLTVTEQQALLEIDMAMAFKGDVK